ncbi:MAG TPA: SGNH/GDSL hydrolase family protein [Vicinamibacterales bacterium]|jgi:lysophospholipase L1-like esterase|nr:SGNH/GDSL hydrolase family protein [Vicinamibacterales bacterium]
MTAQGKRKYIVVAVLVMAAALVSSRASAQAPNPDPARFASEIDAFKAWDAKNATPAHAVLFVGSSTIRLWPTADRFPGLPVINRGFGGSEISDVNHYIRETTLKYAADIVVFYAGDNDINSRKTPAQVLTDFQTFAKSVLAAKADTEILFIAIKPSTLRWALWPAMRDANAAIEQYCKTTPHLHYVDIVPPMFGADGKPRADLLQQDGLHLSSAGYDIWTDVVRKAIDDVRKR